MRSARRLRRERAWALRPNSTPPFFPSPWLPATRRHAPGRGPTDSASERSCPMDRPSCEQLIKDDRAARESKVWRGPFLEYLDLVRDDPSVPTLAHARIIDNIMRVATKDTQEA